MRQNWSPSRQRKNGDTGDAGCAKGFGSDPERERSDVDMIGDGLPVLVFRRRWTRLDSASFQLPRASRRLGSSDSVLEVFDWIEACAASNVVMVQSVVAAREKYSAWLRLVVARAGKGGAHTKPDNTPTRERKQRDALRKQANNARDACEKTQDAW
jgi:hypothetical protein